MTALLDASYKTENERKISRAQLLDVFVRVFICVRTLRAFKQLSKGKCDKFILTGHPDYEKNFWKIELNNFLMELYYLY